MRKSLAYCGGAYSECVCERVCALVMSATSVLKGSEPLCVCTCVFNAAPWAAH